MAFGWPYRIKCLKILAYCLIIWSPGDLLFLFEAHKMVNFRKKNLESVLGNEINFFLLVIRKERRIEVGLI